MSKIVILDMCPQRDWVLDTFIAEYLNEMGHDAVIRKYIPDGRDAVTIEKPDVVVLPPIRCNYTYDFAQRLKAWGVSIVVRRSEAGVSRKKFDSLEAMWQEDHLGRFKYGPLIDAECVWGPEFAQILIDHQRVSEDKVHIVGGVTLDPYFKYDIKEAVGKAKTIECKNPGKVILFASGFLHADHREDFSLPEAPYNDPIHRVLVNRDKAVRDLWIAVMKETAKHHNVIFRPHPDENLSQYSELMGIENLYIDREMGTAVVLKCCDFLVHAGSTMAVEAHLLDKPTAMLGDTSQDDLIGTISPKVNSVGDLLKVIEKSNGSNARIKDLSELEESFYGPIDGQATRRVANVVDMVAREKKNKPEIPNSWPKEELRNYETPGVKKIDHDEVWRCICCKKLFVNSTGSTYRPCPHCGIASTTGA